MGKRNCRRILLILRQVRGTQLSHLAQSQNTNKGIHRLIFMHQESVRTTHCRDEITQGYYVDNSSTNNITTLNFWRILDFIKFAIVLSRHYLSSDFYFNFISNDSICSGHIRDHLYSSSMPSSFSSSNSLPLLFLCLKYSFSYMSSTWLFLLSFRIKVNYHLHSGTFHGHTI